MTRFAALCIHLALIGLVYALLFAVIALSRLLGNDVVLAIWFPLLLTGLLAIAVLSGMVLAHRNAHRPDDRPLAVQWLLVMTATCAWIASLLSGWCLIEPGLTAVPDLVWIVVLIVSLGTSVAVTPAAFLSRERRDSAGG